MKFSYHWLKELSDTEKSPEELAEFLTLRAFEVEEVTPVGFSTENIFVGEVLSIEKHPNADRLRVAKVDLGEKGARTIVCGAPNLETGQRVAVALPGAVLPVGMEIFETDIRGIHSEGMICSEKELGLGEHHEGIMVLSEAMEIGKELRDVLGSSDWLLDVKILPDRAHDALSHVGLAREIAALEWRKLDYDYLGLALPKVKERAPFAISLEAGDKSHRYIGALVKNISVGVSPRWLVDRLGAFGMRSINTIVDATNLIMLELGQPLHAFDWDKLAGGEMKTIGPRFAQPGEKLLLLDGKTYELGGEDIVIADGGRAVALGGIMGGADSAVSPETRNVFFEAAHFDPVSIRRTRTRLGIESDASFRFEKELSSDLAERAMTRLLEVVTHLAGGEVRGVIDERKNVSAPKSIAFSPDEVMALLGTAISEKEMKKILELRECDVDAAGKKLTVSPPPYRLDIESVADIVEEIGKGIGYDRIEPEAPEFSLSATPEEPIRTLETALRTHMAACGFVETSNYSFYGETDARRAKLDTDRHLALENPMNPDQAFVRVSLIPGLLKNIAFNRRRFSDIRLFECGKTYESTEETPKETRLFSGALLLSSAKKEEPFFVLKSEISRLFHSVGVSVSFRSRTSNESLWHPMRSAEIVGSDGAFLGIIGEIHPLVGKSFDISSRVACFEFDARILLNATRADMLFIPIRKYPETLRDLSCFIPERMPVADIERAIFAAGRGLVLGIELFDRYVDAERGRSVAFHVRLGKEGGTLSGEEADAALADIAGALERDLGVSARVAG